MMDANVKDTGATKPSDQRTSAMVFVRDRDSEGLIRQCFADLGILNAEFVHGDVNAAMAQLAHRSSPKLLIVDISGIDEPSAPIEALGQVCEPGTGVIVIGESNDIGAYRNLKAAGIVEYFFKPLVNIPLKRAITGFFDGGASPSGARTGKLVFCLSVRGGAGTTMIATSSAWHLSEIRQRRVMLIDLDVLFGDAALQLNVSPSHALCEALEHPERVDELFLERGVIHVSDRLDLLASLEPLSENVQVSEDAILTLLDCLLHRYRYLFVDLPTTVAPRLLRVMHLPSTCLLVSTGSLVSARDVARWRERIGANTGERTIFHILNKAGAHGSLPQDEFTRVAGQMPDLIIPYSREIGDASSMGVRDVAKCAVLKREMAPLMRHIAGEPAEKPASLFARLFH